MVVRNYISSPPAVTEVNVPFFENTIHNTDVQIKLNLFVMFFRDKAVVRVISNANLST
jgi:hypothetical protein